MVNTKTTAVRVIPAIGCKEGRRAGLRRPFGLCAHPAREHVLAVGVRQPRRTHPAPLQALKKLNFLCAAPLRGGFLSLGGAFRALGKGLRQTLE